MQKKSRKKKNPKNEKKWFKFFLSLIFLQAALLFVKSDSQASEARAAKSSPSSHPRRWG